MLRWFQGTHGFALLCAGAMTVAVVMMYRWAAAGVEHTPATTATLATARTRVRAFGGVSVVWFVVLEAAFLELSGVQQPLVALLEGAVSVIVGLFFFGCGADGPSALLLVGSILIGVVAGAPHAELGRRCYRVEKRFALDAALQRLPAGTQLRFMPEVKAARIQSRLYGSFIAASPKARALYDRCLRASATHAATVHVETQDVWRYRGPTGLREFWECRVVLRETKDGKVSASLEAVPLFDGICIRVGLEDELAVSPTVLHASHGMDGRRHAWPRPASSRNPGEHDAYLGPSTTDPTASLPDVTATEALGAIDPNLACVVVQGREAFVFVQTGMSGSIFEVDGRGTLAQSIDACETDVRASLAAVAIVDRVLPVIEQCLSGRDDAAGAAAP